MTSPLTVVVGAGPGVGAAFAARAAARGHAIGLIARDEARLESLAGRLTAEHGVDVGWAPVDIADADALAAAVTRFASHVGRLDVLLYNAVAGRMGPATSLTPQALLDDLRVGVTGLLAATQAALPAMRAAGAGSVLVTGSGAADRPWPPAASVGVQKAAVRNLVHALAADLAPDGIHVATLTVRGALAEGTRFSPDAVAAGLFALADQTSGPREGWEVEAVLA